MPTRSIHLHVPPTRVFPCQNGSQQTRRLSQTTGKQTTGTQTTGTGESGGGAANDVCGVAGIGSSRKMDPSIFEKRAGDYPLWLALAAGSHKKKHLEPRIRGAFDRYGRQVIKGGNAPAGTLPRSHVQPSLLLAEAAVSQGCSDSSRD